MAPASNEEQFKFLISCIRYSNNGKVDFGQVAKECKIVSKGAAAKRYERMMRAHGIASNAATIKPAPTRAPRTESSNSHFSIPSSSSKKRKADQFLDENPADDEEGYGHMGMTIKSDPADSKEHLFIKEEDQKFNLEQAANLIQYYDNSSSLPYTDSKLGVDDGYNNDYLSGIGSTTGFAAAVPSGYGQMGSAFDLPSQNDSYGFGYDSAGMTGISISQQQSFQYQPSFQYKSEDGYDSAEQGHQHNPVTVE